MIPMEKVRAVLARFGGVLKAGGHKDTKKHCCVRELRANCFNLPWTDRPDTDKDGTGTAPMTATDAASQYFNDHAWCDDPSRTFGCLPLALLSEHQAQEGWERRCVFRYAMELVPDVFTHLAYRDVLPYASSVMDLRTNIAALRSLSGDLTALREHLRSAHQLALMATPVCIRGDSYQFASGLADLINAAGDLLRRLEMPDESRNRNNSNFGQWIAKAGIALASATVTGGSSSYARKYETTRRAIDLFVDCQQPGLGIKAREEAAQPA